MTEYLGINVSCSCRTSMWGHTKQSHNHTLSTQMHERRLVELYQRGILEHGEGGQVEDLLSGRARKAPIYLHSIWGIKTHFTEQMEEGQPDRHLCGTLLNHPTLKKSISVCLKCTWINLHKQATVIYAASNQSRGAKLFLIVWLCICFGREELILRC